jgi:hypothetical protein
MDVGEELHASAALSFTKDVGGSQSRSGLLSSCLDLNPPPPIHPSSTPYFGH